MPLNMQRLKELRKNNPHTSALCHLAEGHSGIQGIAASRLKNQFGMPVAYFCLKSKL